MKIVIASDSYKGSASALEVANAISDGIKEEYKDAEIVKMPIADGGEGTVDAIITGLRGEYREVEVQNPLGNVITAKYGVIKDDLAVIEMAAASGLTLIDNGNLNPLITSTYGTGQLIKDAMEEGARKIYVGLGGSSTNDGGVGMAQALGVSFKDKDGNEIGPGGKELSRIFEIDDSNINPLLKKTEIIGISDVQNPLCGKNGAANVFGPQKGATGESIKILDDNLRHYAEVVKKHMGKDIMGIAGAGAAGGLGGGLVAFCNAKLYSGIDIVLDIIDIDKHLANADLVITGEGKMDGQSIYGKAPIGVAKRAKQYNLPVIAIVGSRGEGADNVYSHGIDIVIDIINKPMSLEEAIKNVLDLIANGAVNAMKIVKLVEKNPFL